MRNLEFEHDNSVKELNIELKEGQTALYKMKPIQEGLKSS